MQQADTRGNNAQNHQELLEHINGGTTGPSEGPPPTQTRPIIKKRTSRDRSGMDASNASFRFHQASTSSRGLIPLPSGDNTPKTTRRSSNANLAKRKSMMTPRWKSNFKKRSRRHKNKRKGSDSNNEDGEATPNKKKPKKGEIQLNLLYIPKYIIEQSERRRYAAFRSFEVLDGQKEFMMTTEKKFPTNSVKGLSHRLKHNSKTQRSYLSFYRTKHRRAVSDVVNQIEDWERREKRMPKVRVVKKRLLNSISLPRIKTELRSKIAYLNGKKEGVDAERLRSVRTFKFCWMEVPEDFPLESREGATFTLVGKFGWLLGGINHRMITSVYRFDLEKKKFGEVKMDFGDMTMPRFNHSAVGYLGKIYFFGGERFTSNNFYSRVCMNDVKILDTEKLTWKSTPQNEDYIAPRRNHACTSFGKYMLIHGGLDQQGTTLSDSWLFNLETYSWMSVYIDSETPTPFLSHHSCVAVFNNPSKITDIYSKRSFDYKDKRSKEGVYFFGGKNPKGAPTNQLIVMKLGSNPVTIQSVKTVGKQPQERFGHCLKLLPKNNQLVLYGGRNDRLFNMYGSCAIEDVHVLNLRHLSWCKVKTGFITGGHRYNFCSFVCRVTQILETNEKKSVVLLKQQKELEKARKRDKDFISPVEKFQNHMQSPFINLRHEVKNNKRKNPISRVFTIQPKTGGLKPPKNNPETSESENDDDASEIEDHLARRMQKSLTIRRRSKSHNFVSYAPLPKESLTDLARQASHGL